MTSTYLGQWEVPAAAFLAARKAAITSPEDRWYVYQCHDLGSPRLGNRFYLLVGPKHTCTTPPAFCPGPSIVHATSVLVGYLDLVLGILLPIEEKA